MSCTFDKVQHIPARHVTARARTHGTAAHALKATLQCTAHALRATFPSSVGAAMAGLDAADMSDCDLGLGEADWKDPDVPGLDISSIPRCQQHSSAQVEEAMRTRPKRSPLAAVLSLSLSLCLSL